MSHAELVAHALRLSISPLGVLSPVAIRSVLAQLDGPVDVVATDLRKLHDWNGVLGFDTATRYLAAFAQVRATPVRPLDLRGQWGGDELIYVVGVGDGPGLLDRLTTALEQFTGTLTAAQRAEIDRRTGGLIDGFAAAMVLAPAATHPLAAAEAAIEQLHVIKGGRITTERATSGAPGTVIAVLAPDVRVKERAA